MRFAHTCYRVLDLDRSLDFYCGALGFELQRKVPIRDEAINAFIALPESPDTPLELTYNLGREEPYEIGTGYGHVALLVDDLDGTLARLEQRDVRPERPPYTVRDGGSRLCFVRDPDGYRIELIERG